MMVPFTEWAPDQAAVNMPSLNEATNVVAAGNGYMPVKSFAPDGSTLPGVISGFTARNQSNGTYVAFAGTATGLFKLAAGVWTNVTRLAGGAYGASTVEKWTFTQYGNFIIAANINDFVQVYDITSATNFSNLAGNPPKARYCGVCGNFLFLACLAGFKNRIQWSGLDNITFWTPAQQNSDFQDFPDGGEITGITSNNNPLIFQEFCVSRGVFQPGSQVVFSFDKIQEERGSFYPYALATRGSTSFFVNDDGFHAISSAGGYEPIGFEKVNRTMFSLINRVDRFDLIAAIDPIYSRVYWLYKSTTNGVRKILSYDWIFKRWTVISSDLAFVMPSASQGITLDQMDAYGNLDTLPYPLDHPFWKGGQSYLSGFNAAGAFGYFNGENMEATITTADAGATDGMITRGTFINPLIERVENSDVFVSIGGKRKQSDAPDWTPERQPSQRTGNIMLRSRRRYQRVKVRIPQGAVWTMATGLDVQAVGTGMK